MSSEKQDMVQTAIDTIRTLSMDAVEAAKSGHPGTPMALAPVAYTLWTRFLKFDPQHPNWPARDRFVLSCGHASMLLYSLLHLAEVAEVDSAGEPVGRPSIALEDIRNFRQWESRCAGHPEFGEASGIETTTGPLGQGVGNSVGMAIAAKWLSAKYDHSNSGICDSRVFTFCSDGDLMEGVGAEAASLAGHLGLNNLCWIYDDNKITIEGNTDLAFSENVAERFRGLGWRVFEVEDANDLAAIHAAFEWFEQADKRPSLICLRSVIGYGAPEKAGSHAAHGAPLGPEEVRGAKRHYGWDENQSFLVPEGVVEHFRETIGRRGGKAHQAWQEELARFCESDPDAAAELSRIWSGKLPPDWDSQIPEFPTDEKGMATRSSSGKVLNGIAGGIPWMLGGSADLAPSNMTELAGESDFSASNHSGRIFRFGIREHAMAAAANGMALFGLRPFVGTFFVFTDYLRPSMRLAAMMGLPVIYIFTHDSIGLGEDGPTHQPVEHLAACRAIPGLAVVRPGDAREVAAAYRHMVQTKMGPVGLVLTRQSVPTLAQTESKAAEGVCRGGYVLQEPASDRSPAVILMASGSEVTICMEAANKLSDRGIAVRVVSMPCQDWFEQQTQEYQDSVLPPDVTARVAVEAGIRQSWDRYLGRSGRFVGMDRFGASAPFEELYERFGITSGRVIDAAVEAIG